MRCALYFSPYTPSRPESCTASNVCHALTWSHVARPTSGSRQRTRWGWGWSWSAMRSTQRLAHLAACRSEEHTSELQSQSNLVCRLLLEKKNADRGVEHVQHA